MFSRVEVRQLHRRVDTKFAGVIINRGGIDSRIGLLSANAAGQARILCDGDGCATESEAVGFGAYVVMLGSPLTFQDKPDNRQV